MHGSAQYFTSENDIHTETLAQISSFLQMHMTSLKNTMMFYNTTLQ